MNPSHPQLAKLDNPVWHSLNERHRPFSLGDEGIKLYAPEICPFGGVRDGEPEAVGRLGQYISHTDPFFLLGAKPRLPAGFELLSDLECAQMTRLEPIEQEITEDIVFLNGRFAAELSELVNLVQPGYFRPFTRFMGEYYGIFRDGKLVAVTGERMRMNDFTEISAVVTHPDYTGRGLAKQLVAYVVNGNLARGAMTYLHVAATNTPAIALYEKLGFAHRPHIRLWKIRRMN